jgi:hypothetical protein
MVATRAYFLPYDDTSAKHKDSMSDPGTTYRTREEVQRMRSTQDPIRGLQRNIEEWGIASDAELKASSDCFPQVVCGGLNPLFRLSIMPQRRKLARLSRRRRARLSRESKISGLIFTIRALSHRPCADASAKRYAKQSPHPNSVLIGSLQVHVY